MKKDTTPAGIVGVGLGGEDQSHPAGDPKFN
jgi:hypothetical protein